MKKILKNKKGVTILEGLIALTLLALVATGTFSVLLSTSRKSQTPDIREEMSLAIENASKQLQQYVVPDWREITGINDELCGTDAHTIVEIPPALSVGDHNINCLLPPICDPSKSIFTYTVSKSNVFKAGDLKNKLRSSDRVDNDVEADSYNIKFSIRCNGFSYDN